MSPDDAVEKILRNPTIDELPDYALKLRRLLMIASGISIVYVLFGISITEVSILGTKIENLDGRILLLLLFSIIAYSLVHFIWLLTDHILEWRLRLTGTKLAHVTAGKVASAQGDYPDDPRKSTLYYWWSEQAKKIGNLRAIGSRSQQHLDQLASYVNSTTDPNHPTNAGNITRAISDFQRSLASFERQIKAATEAIQAARVPVSLQRFDAAYSLLQTSQNLRFLTFEIGLPIFLSVLGAMAAIYKSLV